MASSGYLSVPDYCGVGGAAGGLPGAWGGDGVGALGEAVIAVHRTV